MSGQPESEPVRYHAGGITGKDLASEYAVSVALEWHHGSSYHDRLIDRERQIMRSVPDTESPWETRASVLPWQMPEDARPDRVKFIDWTMARWKFVESGSTEDYEAMLSAVTPASPPLRSDVRWPPTRTRSLNYERTAKVLALVSLASGILGILILITTGRLFLVW